jgi:hypothetical protein
MTVYSANAATVTRSSNMYKMHWRHSLFKNHPFIFRTETSRRFPFGAYCVDLTDAAFPQEPTGNSNHEHHDHHTAVIQVSKDVHFTAGVNTASIARSSIMWNILDGTSTGLWAVRIVGRQRVHGIKLKCN